MSVVEPTARERVFQRDQEKALKVQERTEREGVTEGERSPARKALSYAELAGIIFLLGKFRKPLLKLASKVFKDVQDEVIKVDEKLKQEIEVVELALRKAIVNDYLLDPIQSHRIGPEMYRQLVVNAGWHNSILTDLDAIPAEVAPTFTVGTGPGSITVTSNLTKALSVHVLIMCEAMIARSRDLHS